MNVLIIGGSGFLGQHLIKKLIACGHRIKVLDRSRPRWVAEGFDFIEGDFSSTHLLGDVLDSCEVVFHLASTTLPKSSNDDPLFDVSSNLVGTIALLDLAVRKKVRRFIFASSGGTVYGAPSILPVPENHPTMPTCSYGIVKLAIEKYLRLYNQMYGLETCSLRLANPYGEYQRVNTAQGAVAVFCYKALNNEPIEIWGDGTVVRDFVYIGDVIDAMVKSLEAEFLGGEINIGSGSGVSLNQLISCAEECLGTRIEVNYLPSRNFDVQKIYLDVTLANKVLGWKPKTNMADGVLRYISWLRDGGCDLQS